MKTIDRIMLFIKHMKLSARKFDISIGASNGYTLRMHKNNASVGSDVIEKILKVYPRINLVWLMTGKGEMFLPAEEFATSEVAPSIIEQIVNERIDARMIEERKQLKKEIIAEIDQEIKANS
ncbi:hypothetical protein ABN763_01525 [Spongiivirga sp. MCCC 1A20706]|uniref:hypothetical protein n=1 Tax=Spongiivirga sp. MCCC 1A20706 TaxID=3160963 RepID=UPI003977B411